MEREQIIKALECCIEGECDGCTYDEQTACKEYLLTDALALIKELIEENERLRAENEKFKRTCDDCGGCAEWVCDCANIESHVKADTVREMQSEIKKRCIEGGIYPAFVGCTVNQVAYEITGDDSFKPRFMLEGK